MLIKLTLKLLTLDFRKKLGVQTRKTLIMLQQDGIDLQNSFSDTHSMITKLISLVLDVSLLNSIVACPWQREQQSMTKF